MARRKLYITFTRDGDQPDDCQEIDVRGIDWASVSSRVQSGTSYSPGSWLIEVSTDGSKWATAEQWYDPATGSSIAISAITSNTIVRHIPLGDVPLMRIRNTNTTPKAGTAVLTDFVVYGEGEYLLPGEPNTIAQDNKPLRISTGSGIPTP